MLNESPENRDKNADDDFQEGKLTKAKRFKTIFDQSFEFIGLLGKDGVLLEAKKTKLLP